MHCKPIEKQKLFVTFSKKAAWGWWRRSGKQGSDPFLLRGELQLPVKCVVVVVVVVVVW